MLENDGNPAENGADVVDGNAEGEDELEGELLASEPSPKPLMNLGSTRLQHHEKRSKQQP